MAVSREQNFQVVEEGALPVTGLPARSSDEVILAALDNHINFPLRLSASQPTADANLHIDAAEVTVGDGAGRVIGPQSDIIVTTVAGMINMQTGLLTGPSVTLSGTTYTTGQTLVFPVSAGVGKYRRMIITSQSDSTLIMGFGAEYASLALLVADSTQNAGALAALLGGTLIGYVDLQSTATSTAFYKTADSASSIIENSNSSGIRIHRIPAGAGGGGGSATDFKVQSITANVATLKKGYLALSDGRILTTSSDGSTPDSQLTLNLKTQVNSAGVTAPSASTLYYLYLDLTALPSTASVDTTTGQLGYLCAQGTTGPFVILTTDPSTTSPSRYVFLQALKTDGSSNYTLIGQLFGREAFVDVQRAALPVTGEAAGTARETVLTNIDQQFDLPYRMAASATPDAFVNFSATQVTLGDGSLKVVAPQTGQNQSLIATSKINMGTGAVTGSMVFYMNGTTFATAFAALTKTDTKYRRFVFAAQPDNTVLCAPSSEATSQALLTAFWDLFGTVKGVYLGHIDLQWVNASTKYQTPSAATVAIYNAGIARPGTSGGASPQAPLTLSYASSPNLITSGGALTLADGRELMSWDGGGTDTANYGKSLTISGTTILTAGTGVGGGGSVAASTTYHVYLDLTTLGTVQTIATGAFAGRSVYRVTAANYVAGTTVPSSANLARYLWCGTVTTTSGSAWSGTGATLIPASRQEGMNLPVAVSPRIVTPASGSTVSAVGTSGQIAQGHVLSSKSFPSGLSSANLAYWNLANGSGTDQSSGGTHGLTPAASTPATGAAGILATALEATQFASFTSPLFASTSAFFNPTGSFAYGGWFFQSAWTAAVSLMGQWPSNSDRGHNITLASGTVSFQSNTTGGASTNDSPATVALPGGTASGWYHIFMVFDATLQQLRGYINGKLVQTFTTAGTAQRATVGQNFTLGKDGNVGSYFTGIMEALSFYSGAIPTDQDIKKLASYRKDHNTATQSQYQDWHFNYYPAGGEPAKPFLSSPLVSQGDSNSVFWDLSDCASTDTVDIYCLHTGLTPNVVSAGQMFDTTYTVAPTTVAHGQTDIPHVEVLQETTANTWQDITTQGYVTQDATNLNCDFSGLPQAVGVSPNRIRIRAYVGQRPASVTNATTAVAGVVVLGSMTGFNKIVGTGSGAQYATLTAATLTAGDSVLINSSTTEPAGDLTIPAGVMIFQMPNTQVGLSGALTSGVIFSGNKAKWVNMDVLVAPSGNVTQLANFTGSDNWVEGLIQFSTNHTATNGVSVQAGALRNRVQIGVNNSGGGTVTTLENNLDGAGSIQTWGG